MASKLDELMALALEMKDRASELDYENGSHDAYSTARAALQSALKAVVEDAERYRWLRDKAKIMEFVKTTIDTMPKKWDAAIDAARKP